MSKKTYPPENIERLNNSLCERVNRLWGEAEKKAPSNFAESTAIYEELIHHLAILTHSPEMIGTYQAGSGFPAVDPAHFRKVENTRMYHFFKYALNEPTCDMLQHELSLMIQEIKDLRAVLQVQFHYDWTQHRSNFPLIAQRNA